jgi:DNA mismatch repair ATPase MutS
MAFQSILFSKTGESGRLTDTAPDFFRDLNLDQVVRAILAKREVYGLERFYYTSLHDLDTLHYRQEVSQELEKEDLLQKMDAFSERMSRMRIYRESLKKMSFQYHRDGWFLETIQAYCEAVSGLASDLEAVELRSRGLLDFREYLRLYVGSEAFQMLFRETEQLKVDLSALRYAVNISGLTVRVRKYHGEPDYSVEVEKTFERFKQGAAKDYLSRLNITSGMNHVEAAILDRVARLFPEVFQRLDEYCARHKDFLDPIIERFDLEIQFYTAYLNFLLKIKKPGLKTCYPDMASDDKEIYVTEGYDLALANKRLADEGPLVPNDFHLQGPERVIVVSGPNQGGKTTFARMFGQLHFLGSLGLPVPGSRARLFLFDRLFTHFERQENIKNLRGKLQDDLVRIHAILDQSTPESIIIMNEIFTATTLKDAVFLGRKIMERIVALDALCVFVTFIDELASFSEKTVSMVSTVVPENPAERTFKILRRPADGLAYALSIAEKYRLTYAQLRERLPS